jgi:hypothetical protein
MGHESRYYGDPASEKSPAISLCSFEKRTVVTLPINLIEAIHAASPNAALYT